MYEARGRGDVGRPAKSLADVLVEKGLMTKFQAETVRRTLAAEGEKRVIGGFEIVQKIGEGGMGAVYRARQISMDSCPEAPPRAIGEGREVRRPLPS